MEAMPRQSSTDHRFEERFDRLDGEIISLRHDINTLRKEGRESMREEIKGVETGLRNDIGGVRTGLAALYLILIRASFGIVIAALTAGAIAAFAAIMVNVL